MTEKEIWMEKLIELLNEFNKEKWWHPWLLYEWFWVRKWDLNFIFNHSKFPFIKWLVENDKIKLEKFPQIMEYSDLESLLMYLSIQDEPIRFLCEILK